MGTLTAETLELIHQTAREAEKAEILSIEGDGREVLVRIGNELKPVGIPPANRAHVVHTLDDLTDYATAAAATDKTLTVWHAGQEVVLILDDADRRDRVTFPLHFSEPFGTLCNLRAERRPLDQAAFIRLLRVDLGLDNVAVVDQFRRLQWSGGTNTASNRAHAKESLGHEVMAEVQGTDKLPDELVLHVPVYRDRGERDPYAVKCAVEIDVHNQRLELVPLPGELENAEQAAQSSIAGRLADHLDLQTIRVYYGSPLSTRKG